MDPEEIRNQRTKYFHLKKLINDFFEDENIDENNIINFEKANKDNWKNFPTLRNYFDILKAINERPFPESFKNYDYFDEFQADNNISIQTLSNAAGSYNEIIDDLTIPQTTPEQIKSMIAELKQLMKILHPIAVPPVLTRRKKRIDENISFIGFELYDMTFYLKSYMLKLTKSFDKINVKIDKFNTAFKRVFNAPPTESRVDLYNHVVESYEIISGDNKLLDTFLWNNKALPLIKSYRQEKINPIVNEISKSQLESLKEYEQDLIDTGSSFSSWKEYNNFVDLLVCVLSESNRELIALQNHLMNLNKIYTLALNKTNDPFQFFLNGELVRPGDAVFSPGNVTRPSRIKRGGRLKKEYCDGSMTDPSNESLYKYFKVTGIAKTFDELLHDFKGKYLNEEQINHLKLIYNPVINHFIGTLQPDSNSNEKNIKDFIEKLIEQSLGQQEWNYYTTVLWYIDNYCDGIDDLYMAKVVKVKDYPFLNEGLVRNQDRPLVNDLRKKGYIYNLGGNDGENNMVGEDYYYTTIDNNPVSKEFDQNKFDYRFSDNYTANSKIIMLLNDLEDNTISKDEIDNFLSKMKDIKYAPGLMDPKTLGGILITEMTHDGTDPAGLVSNNPAQFIQLCQNINSVPSPTPSLVADKNLLLQNGQILAKNILIDGINTFIGYFGSNAEIIDVNFIEENDKYIGVEMNAREGSSYRLYYGDTTIENISDFYKSYYPAYINKEPSNPSWKRLWNFAIFIYSGIQTGPLVETITGMNNALSRTNPDTKKNAIITEIIITLKSFGDSLQVYYKQRWMKKFLKLDGAERFHSMPLTSTDKNVGGESLLLDSEFWLIGTGIRPHPSFFQKYIGFFGKMSFQATAANDSITVNEQNMDGSKAIVTNAERESDLQYIFKIMMNISENLHKLMPSVMRKHTTGEVEEGEVEEFYPQDPFIDNFNEASTAVQASTDGQTSTTDGQTSTTDGQTSTTDGQAQNSENIFDILKGLLSENDSHLFDILNLDGQTHLNELIGNISENLERFILDENTMDQEGQELTENDKESLLKINKFLTQMNDVILFTNEPVEAEVVESTHNHTSIQKMNILTSFVTLQYDATIKNIPKKFTSDSSAGTLNNLQKKLVSLNNIIDDKLIRFANEYMTEYYQNEINSLQKNYTTLLENSISTIDVSIDEVGKKLVITSSEQPASRPGRARKVINYAKVEQGNENEISLQIKLQKDPKILNLQSKLQGAKEKLETLITQMNLPKKKNILNGFLQKLGLTKTNEKKIESARKKVEIYLRSIDNRMNQIKNDINTKLTNSIKIVSPEEKRKNTISILSKMRDYLFRSATQSRGGNKKAKKTKKKRKQKKHTKKLKYRKKSTKSTRKTEKKRK